MSVFKRFGAGVFAGAYGQIVTVAVQFLALPIFIARWGQDAYGSWLMLSAIPAYLALSDMGFSSVAANQMAMEVAADRRDAARATFEGTLGILLYATAFVLGVSVLTSLLFIAADLHIGTLSAGVVAVVVPLLGLQVAATFFSGLISAGMRCEGYYARATAALHTVRFVEAIGQAAFIALFTTGPVGAAVSVLVIRILGMGFMAVDLARLAPWLRWQTSGASISVVRSHLGAALSFAVWPLTAALQQQGLVVLIGTIVGAPAVVLWSACRTLARTVTQGFGILNAPLWPEISHAYGQGNLALTRRLHHIAAGAAIWGVVPATVTLFLMKDWIVAHWSGGRLMIGNSLFFIVLLQTALSVVWGTSSVVISAVNRHQTLTLGYLAVTVLSLAACWPLALQASLHGAAWASLIPDLVMVPVAWRMALRVAEDSNWSFFTEIALFPVRLSGRLRARMRT